MPDDRLVPDVVAARDLTCPTCAAPPDQPCVDWPSGSVHPSRCKVVEVNDDDTYVDTTEAP